MCWILVCACSPLFATCGVKAVKATNGTDWPIEKLSSIVRSVSMNQDNRENGHRHQNSAGSNRNTPIPWDPQTGQEDPNARPSHDRRGSRDSHAQGERDQRDRERDAQEVQRARVERYGSQSGPRTPHLRQESGNNVGSSDEYGTREQQHHHTNNNNNNNNNSNNTGRRHDYDVQSMETAISSPRASITKNPIPAPTVTVRSEYPTLTRSRQQQSLTCLVTIEVPEGKWRPDPADLRGAPVLPSAQQDSNTFSDRTNRPKSPAPAPNDWQFESSETLEEITEDLRVRVDNWHGLDFQR